MGEEADAAALGHALQVSLSCEAVEAAEGARGLGPTEERKKGRETEKAGEEEGEGRVADESEEAATVARDLQGVELRPRATKANQSTGYGCF